MGKRLPDGLKTLLLLLSAPLLLVTGIFGLVGALFYLLYGLILQVAVWLDWNRKGIDVLLVTSDSPHWKEDIETKILSRLKARAVVLNWSERSQWTRRSLPVLVFYYFGGGREFNPLAVVFKPLRWARVFRFWRAYKDYKHDKSVTLRRVQAELFAALDLIA